MSSSTRSLPVAENAAPRPRKRLPAMPPITTKNRALRALWQTVWLLLFRPSPVPAHRWRAALLRLFGAEITTPVYTYPTTQVWAPWNLTMKAGSCLSRAVECYNVAPVVLNERALVSQKSYLCTVSHDFNDPAFPLIGAPITLEAEAWVSAEAFVGPGVTVGARAVVLARGVVVRDVTKGAVVAGNPAREVSQRVAPTRETTEGHSA